MDAKHYEDLTRLAELAKHDEALGLIVGLIASLADLSFPQRAFLAARLANLAVGSNQHKVRFRS